MKALRFDLKVPFWSSFGDFSSLNIKLSYPCPPLTTLFGLIQNALGKEALYNIDNKRLQNKIKKQYIEDFNNLKFSIIINYSGELIEDYVNIHKGSREKEKIEENLRKKLKEFIENSPYENILKENISEMKKFSFYEFILNKNNNEDYKVIYEDILQYEENLIDEITNYWNDFSSPKDIYNINKIWLSTQINRQRLIEPEYSIYILSENDDEFSLENIMSALNNPKRSLYLGESDDVVDILNISLVDINATKSSCISSIIPGLYSNSELIKIPISLKFDTENDYYALCSIPKGEIDTVIDCYEYNGENFVFL